MAYFDLIDSYLSDTASNASAEEHVRRNTPPPPVPVYSRPPAIPFATRPVFAFPTVPVAVSSPVPSTPSSVHYWHDDDVPRLINWVPPFPVPFAGADPVQRMPEEGQPRIRERRQPAPAPQQAQIPGYVQLPVVDPQNATLTDAVVQLTTLLTNQQAMDMHRRQQQITQAAQPKKYIALPEGFDGQTKNWKRFVQQCAMYVRANLQDR